MSWWWIQHRRSSSRPSATPGHHGADAVVSAAAFWSALGFVLVIEGLLPFLSPARWRRGIGQLMELRDGQLRFVGLGAIVAGLFVLWLVA